MDFKRLLAFVVLLSAAYVENVLAVCPHSQFLRKHVAYGSQNANTNVRRAVELSNER